VRAAAIQGHKSVPRIASSEFEDLLCQRTITATTYAGVPLATETSKTRGKILRKLARRVDAECHKGAVFVDTLPKDKEVPFHWQRDGIRVLSRSTQLTWNKGTRCWCLNFQNINLANIDELILSIYTPDGIYLHSHNVTRKLSIWDPRANQDLTKSTVGNQTLKQSRQRRIALFGPTDEEDWESALDGKLLPQLIESGCEHLDFIEFDDPHFLPAAAAHPPSITAIAFDGVPLADCSPQVRGDLLMKLASKVDAQLHPDSVFEEANPGYRADGRFRGDREALYHWRRDGKRVACKSSQIAWDNSKNCWRLNFQNIKLESCDELLLMVYAPSGCYLYRHDVYSGMSTKGVLTRVCGKSQEENWEHVLDTLDELGWECLAMISWP